MRLLLSSPQNERFKSLSRLEKRSERDSRRVTLVEGAREVRRALEAGHVPVEAYLCAERIHGEDALSAAAILARLEAEGRVRLTELTPELYAKAAVREESGGILLVLPYITRSLTELPLKEPAFLAVIEGVEKPGNLGAILRTADAVGVDAVIVSAGVTDVHNPNVVRASLGTLFSVPLAEAPPEEAIAFLRARRVHIVDACNP